MQSRPELQWLDRRVRMALFGSGFFEALAVTALVLGCGLLVARFVGGPSIVRLIEPNWWWSTLLAVPVVWGGVRLRATATERELRGYLDRNLELRGLLLSEGEVDTSAWESRIRAGLKGARHALPGFPVRRWLRWVAPAIAFLAAVLLLPKPQPPRSARNVIQAAAATEIEEKLEHLVEQGVIDEELRQELEARMQKLEDAFERGEDVAWADLDALDAKLDQEAATRTTEIEKARAALADFANSASSKGTDARDELGELLEQAKAAGLLSDLAALPKELRDMLQNAGVESSASSGAVDLSKLDSAKLPQSAAELAELASELAELAQGQLGKLARAGVLDPGELADLGELMAGMNRPLDPGHEHTPECAGGS